MKKNELESKLARLESINDLLVTELENIHETMKILGFSNGIHTLKQTAEIIIENCIYL